MKEQLKVACFYQYMENFLLLKDTDETYDIVRVKALCGEDDIKALNELTTDLKIECRRNFKQVARDDLAVYYTATLAKPPVFGILHDTLELGILRNAAEALDLRLTTGLAGIIRNIYLGVIKDVYNH